MIDFDPVATFPELRELQEATQRWDWPAVAGLFATLTDPDDRSWAVRIVADVADSEGFLRPVAEREPGTLPRLLLAERLVVVGWKVRTSAQAKHVSQAQFDTLHDYLRQAERILIDITALEPDNALAWCARLTTNRGLQLGQAEARRRYDRAVRAAPHFYGAQASLVQQFCQKWSGSDEKVRAFAIECMRGAPPGSQAPLSVVTAHFEIGIDWDDGRKLPAYLQRPDVRAEIDEAADRSVRHPEFQPGRFGFFRAHSMFALAFAKMGDYAAVRPHFQAVGERPMADSLWGYFGNKQTVFQDLRAKAFQA